MKRLLFLGVLILAGCGSEPAPQPPPPTYPAMVLTSTANYEQEGAAITACGNTIVEGSVGPIAGAYKFRGYSAAIACYRQVGHYSYFFKP